MARIINLPYQHAAQLKALQLGYRELLQYNLNAGDWNSLSISMLVTLVAPDGSMVAHNDEHLYDTTAPYKASMSWGLKTADSLWLTETPRCLAFVGKLGVRLRNFSYKLQADSNKDWTSGHPMATGAEIQYAEIKNTSSEAADNDTWRPVFLKATSSNPGFCPGIIQHMVTVRDKGQPTQHMRITMRSSSSSVSERFEDWASPNPLYISEIKLRSRLQTPTSSKDIPWLATDGSAAPLPETFYVYWPFANSRLCLMALLIEKVD